ncbi:MAG TPA: hypothetical protein ENK18_21630 [Deltaproteobacteria bacterium]|nr:hypothetical protein [Deltaproteobacteria bacterium]
MAPMLKNLDVSGLSLRRMRAVTAVLILGCAALGWNLVAGVALILEAWRSVGEGVAAWAMLGAFVGLPLAVVLALVGQRAEAFRATSHAPLSSWGVLGLSLTLVIHWLPLCLWPFALWGAALAQPWRAEPLLLGSIVSLCSWLAVAMGAGVGVVALRSLASAQGSTAREPSWWLPTRILIAAAYLFACSPAALSLVLWLSSSGWRSGAGLPAILAWLSAGIAVVSVSGGFVGVWAGAFELAASALDRRAIWARVAGLLFAAHWLPVFFLAILGAPSGDDDLQWTLILASYVGVLVGAAFSSSTHLWAPGPEPA